jgi:hypothetical protein
MSTPEEMLAAMMVATTDFYTRNIPHVNYREIEYERDPL